MKLYATDYSSPVLLKMLEPIPQSVLKASFFFT